MAIYYELHKNPDPIGDAEISYHARVVGSGTVSTDQLIKSMMKGSSASIGEIQGILTMLAEKLTEFLGEGRQVTIDGIGTFQINLQCKDKILDPNKARANDIEFKSVSFRADKKLRTELKKKKILKSKYSKQSMNLSDEQIVEILVEYFKEEESISRKGLLTLCGLTKSTATRTLKRLAEKGVIRNITNDTHPVYVLNKTGC